MTKTFDTAGNRLDPEQVEDLLRELLEDDGRREPRTTRFDDAFCASGGKTPVC